MVATRKAITPTYIYQDHLSGTAVTDSGTPSTMTYYTFGDRLESQGNLGTDKLFTGQRLDGTGLYYYGARYYDPDIGRFISADTIIPNPANPQSLNRYTYCLNNPLRYVDPTGHAEGDTVVGTTEQDAGDGKGKQTYNVVRDKDGGFRLVDPRNGGSFAAMTLQGLIGFLAGNMAFLGDYGIGNSRTGPVVTFNVQTNLMWGSVPVHYAREGFVGNGIPGNALGWLGAPGISLDFAGGAYIRYEQYATSGDLYAVTMHECYHYFEQSLAGALGLREAWYGEYGAEYGVRLARNSGDAVQAHNALFAERRAEAFAANPSQQRNMFVNLIINIVLIIGR